jgi:CheY-like chemotaxis protein
MITLVADPSPLNRRFARVAALRAGATEVQEVTTMRELVDAIARQEPDVVVVDVRIEDGSEIELIGLLERTTAAVIVVSLRTSVIETAEALGFVTVRKASLRFTEELEHAIASAVAPPSAEVGIDPTVDLLRRAAEHWSRPVDDAEVEHLALSQ